MITEDLVAYIQAQIRKTISRDSIIENLTQAGWRREDVDEAFSKIDTTPRFVPNIVPPSQMTAPVSSVSIATEAKKSIDPYRELPEISKMESVAPIMNGAILSKIKNEEPKVWTPMKVQPIIEATPVVNIAPSVSVTPITKVETQIPPVSSSLSTLMQKQFKDTTIAESLPKVNQASAPVSTPIGTVIPIIKISQPVPIQEVKPIEVPTPVSIPIPEPISTPIQNSVPVPTVAPISTSIKMPIADVLPKKMAMSTLLQDFPTVNPLEESPRKKKATLGWLVAVLILVTIGGGIFLGSVLGYIKIPNFDFSFIKKDPKITLLNTPTALSALGSYKIETSVQVSFPSFASITSGLVSGEAVNPSEKDSVSVNINGAINQTGLSPLLSSYVAIFKSSIFKNDITIGFKHDGINSFVNVPDTINQVLGDGIATPGVVVVPNKDIKLVTTLVPENIQEKFKNTDIYQILSNAIPASVNSPSFPSLKELVDSATVTEKGVENIRDESVSRYTMSVDRQITKKLLTQITDSLTLNFTDEEKKSFDEVIGATTIDSFDFWAGKNDNGIRQYEVILNVPLSKVLGLNDKSIGNNEVRLDWKTTYYDFNVPNNIEIPKDTIKVDDFIKNVNNAKFKSTILSFAPLARNLLNAEGNYGKYSNKVGSCINPTKGSLFSPLGHKKGSETAVSSIASSMNDILKKSNNMGSCYSNSKDWAIAFPIEGTNSFFCVDSTGASKDLTTQLLGPVCK